MEIVSGVVRDLSDRVATISVDAPVACPRCASGKGCGAATLVQDERLRELRVDVPDSLGLRQGDPVSLSIAPKYLLRAAFYAYGLPLGGVLAAVGIAWSIGLADSDMSSVAFAALGLLLGVMAGRRMMSGTAACQQFTPQIDRARSDQGGGDTAE